jgi:hypothetical protein
MRRAKAGGHADSFPEKKQVKLHNLLILMDEVNIRNSCFQ